MCTSYSRCSIDWHIICACQIGSECRVYSDARVRFIIQRIALSLMQFGLLFVVLTFVFGEFIAPFSESTAQQLRLKSLSSVVAQEFRSGMWVKDEKSFVNVRELLPGTKLVDVKI